MKTLKRSILAIAVGLLAISDAHAFRCGTALAIKGDHLIEILKKCGEPDYKEKYVKEGFGFHQIHPVLSLQRIHGTIAVDVWTYNRGPHRFIRQLTFENGFLKKIKSLGYGF